MKRLALAIALAASLVGCSATRRIVTGRCPTTATYLTDFVLSGALMAVSVVRDTERRVPNEVAYGVGGMSIAVSANLAGRCHR